MDRRRPAPSCRAATLAAARTLASARPPPTPRGGHWGLWWVGRKCCAACVVAVAVGAVALYQNYGWWVAARLAARPPAKRRDACAPPPPPPETVARRPRIGVLTLADPAGASTARYAALAAYADAALANKRAYADFHGYELVVAEAETTAARPAPWSKLAALRAHLPKFDWLLYLDGDALVANPAVCLEGLVDDAYDVVLAEDWGGYNTGVFLVKNSAWAAAFLGDMWDAATTYDLARKNPWYDHALPFEFEQRALHFFADTPTWRAAAARRPGAVPRTPGDAAAVRARIKVLPQCALNSRGRPRHHRARPSFFPPEAPLPRYLVRPRLRSPDAAHRAAAYARGDFVVHLAGHKGANKAALFDYALADLVAAPDPATTPRCHRHRGKHHRAAPTPPPPRPGGGP